MNVRSVAELQDFLDSELAWRKKEISNLKAAALSSKGLTKNTMFRAVIPIIYAHWEGFVKQAAIAVLKYFVTKKYKYSEMKHSFLAYAILEKYQRSFPAKKFESLADALVFSGMNLDVPMKLTPEVYIDTQSNLNSEVLRDITKKIGLSFTSFELKSKFIDESFLAVRNQICHGERVVILESDFLLICDEVAALINLFNNESINYVITQQYLR